MQNRNFVTRNRVSLWLARSFLFPVFLFLLQIAGVFVKPARFGKVFSYGSRVRETIYGFMYSL